MSLTKAEWPKATIPEPVKKLIARFYACVDSMDSEAAQTLANEVFTPDGTFKINKRVLRGKAEIPQWGAGGEQVIAKREHIVDKVHICDDEVLTEGTLYIASKEGRKCGTTYMAKCVVDDVDSETPRIKHWQGWVDNVPMAEIGLFKVEVIPQT